MLLYFWSVVLAFMVLVAQLSPHLSLLELGFAAIPVGSIGGAWLFFLVTMLLSFLRCAHALACQTRERLALALLEAADRSLCLC
jgi:hypothetical protein